MATQMEGLSAKGIFGATASSGRAFNGKRFKGPKSGALDRFAEELSKHIDQDDIDAGVILSTGVRLPEGTLPNAGGDARCSARRVGCKASQGQAMLQRIRKRLGWQAV